MDIFRRGFVSHYPVNKYICQNAVRFIREKIEKNPKREYFDGEHVLQLHPQLFLMFFSPKFDSQTAHYHIGDPRDPNNLCSNGGGKRVLFGFTNTGIGIRTGDITDVIPPNSFCKIIFPGNPPTLHQFLGTESTGEGTGLLSFHPDKKEHFPGGTMESYTVFA